MAYVVDTGILTSHTVQYSARKLRCLLIHFTRNFKAERLGGANFANTVNTDENGHGTHVSGTIGGTTFGVAKSVSLVAVKVLDADGAGTSSATLSGLQFGECLARTSSDPTNSQQC